MKTKTILYAFCLVLVSIFLLSYVWEFVLEDTILPFFIDGYESEPAYERWEYVITATLFAALALTLPAILLIRTAARLRAIRQQLEERAESLSAQMGRIIENSLHEVYVLDAESLNFVQVNRRGRENLGLSLEQLQTCSCADLVPGWTRESFKATLEPLRTGARDELVLETVHQRQDGSQYEVECRIQYLPLEHPPVFVAMLQDIGERKRMEAQIVDARNRAEAASAAKSLFLANISHELRTPLAAVIGMSEVLGHTPLSAEQKHYVDTIHNSGTAFLDIIDGLLDLSLIESGKFRPGALEFELHSVVEALLDMLAYRACQRGLELLSLVDADVPASLCGDALALRQILINLLGNAIKFTNKGVVDLHVSVVERSSQRCRLRFAVRDTGVGIAAEFQNELFKPFTQAAVSEPRQDAGAGLGLSICKTLIESMQGTLGLDSVVGEGSLFWCELEFAIGALSAGETASASALAGRRGLVVDDTPLARSVLQTQLEALGARTDIAGDATAALELLRRAIAGEDPYAFALIDTDMPDIDGLSLAYAIKSDPLLAGTRLLMLTPLVTPITATTQQRISFELQCAKPVSQSQLPDILGSLLADRRAVVEQQPAAHSAATEEARPLRVMVVEDQPVNLELMQLILRRLDCEVTPTDSAEQALRLLCEHAQDVIFMDCLMPGMDGYAATAAIRRRESDHQRIVIIAMTALKVQGERERCLAAGMDDYLCKPVNEALMRITLQRWFPWATLGGDKNTGAAIQSDEVAEPLRRLLSNRPEQVARLVELFVDNTAQSLEAMRETLQLGDDTHADLANRAHALKGACLQLGMARMADLCARLEEAGRSADQDAAEALLRKLSEAFDQSRTELLVLSARQKN